jgi:hypothetical protein
MVSRLHENLGVTALFGGRIPFGKTERFGTLQSHLKLSSCFSMNEGSDERPAQGALVRTRNLIRVALDMFGWRVVKAWVTPFSGIIIARDCVRATRPSINVRLCHVLTCRGMSLSSGYEEIGDAIVARNVYLKRGDTLRTVRLAVAAHVLEKSQFSTVHIVGSEFETLAFKLELNPIATIPRGSEEEDREWAAQNERTNEIPFVEDE